MKVVLALAFLGPLAPPAAQAADSAPRAVRVYVAGESIERRNRWVAPPFTASGALNDRGGGEPRNDTDEYGWMVPMRDRLRLRAPDLTMEFVGSDSWADADDAPYSGSYPTTSPEPTSAISGTSIPSWLEQRRAELESRTFCYDLAFASRGGNDLGNDDDAEYKSQLKELVRLLARGSSCRTDPIVVVTGHMPDDQRSGEPDAEYVALELHRFVERSRDAVAELAASDPGLRVRFVDQYTPFLRNAPTTAFPRETWSTGGIPDYAKIARVGDGYHPRRLASAYAGELAADALDLAELRGESTFHPADTNEDGRIVLSECTAYAAAWKAGSPWTRPPAAIPVDYATNACFLWKTGEVYHHDASVTPPWVPGAAAPNPPGAIRATLRKSGAVRAVPVRSNDLTKSGF